jgi:hypothetical protein
VSATKPSDAIIVGGVYELVTTTGEVRHVRPLALDGDRVITDGGMFCSATFCDRWKLVAAGDWTVIA